jgi:hypothetical protein
MLRSLRKSSNNDVATYGFAFEASEHDLDPLLVLFLRLLLQGDSRKCLMVGGVIPRIDISSSIAAGSGLATPDSTVASLIHKAMSERRHQHDTDAKNRNRKAKEVSPPDSNVAPCDAWAALQVERVLEWLVRIFAADEQLSGNDSLAGLARDTASFDLTTACVPLALTGPGAPLSPVRATSATPVVLPSGGRGSGGRGVKLAAVAGKE